MPRVMIWPLRTKLSAVAGLVAVQQRPRYTGGRVIPVLPQRPYDMIGARVVGRSANDRMPLKPNVVHALKFSPISFVAPIIAGVQSIGGMSGLLIMSLKARLGARLLVNQQRPRYTGWRPVPKLPTLPLARFTQGKRPPVVQVRPPVVRFALTGITLDSAGAVIPSADVELYITGAVVVSTNRSTPYGKTVSDSVTGVYLFYVGGGLVFFAVGYLAGSPDIFGTTVNTLTGTSV